MRKIAVVTGSRAEYDLLYWIMRGIRDDSRLKLQLIVTGTHLSPEFGLTVKEIEKDGFRIAEKVDMGLFSDTEKAIADYMGKGLLGFSETYRRLKPDLIVLLGDRFEIFSAAAAAMPFRIPVAHIHGGEATEGLIDEAMRHSITKMSHIHFTAAEKYAKRVVQMGERPERVFTFGAPGLDNIRNLRLMDREELVEALGLPRDKKIGIVTYHPVTLEKNKAGGLTPVSLSTLSAYRDVYWVFTLPNADTGGRVIVRMIKDFVGRHPARGRLFDSLGRVRYLSLLKYAALMVGNSSSGLIEAPSFGLPVVNLGDRQRGRLRGRNVIDVPRPNKKSLKQAIDKALSPSFRDSLKDMRNPYGKGNASAKIVDKLKVMRLGEPLIKKRFFEII